MITALFISDPRVVGKRHEIIHIIHDLFEKFIFLGPPSILMFMVHSVGLLTLLGKNDGSSFRPEKKGSSET